MFASVVNIGPGLTQWAGVWRALRENSARRAIFENAVQCPKVCGWQGGKYHRVDTLSNQLSRPGRPSEIHN